MSAVNLVILLVSVACVVVQEDVVAAAHLDFVGAQVMVGEVTVPVDSPLGAAVCHLVDGATAGHLLTVDVRSYHMPMEMALGNVAEAEVEI